MIRWKYMAPRLVLAAAALGFFWFGMDPLVKWFLVGLGQSATRQKVEIAGLRTSLARCRIELDDVRIAHPTKAMKNLVEADGARLELDGSALFKRKLVVERGSLTGLRFETDRETSGDLDGGTLGGFRDWFVGQLAGADLRWLEAMQAPTADDLERLAEELDLETVRTAREIEARWKVKYEGYRQRLETMRGRLARLKKLVREDEGSTFQRFERYRQAAAEVDRMYQELRALPEEIGGLETQAERDLAALEAAKERDIARAEELIRDPQVDAEKLAVYLLGEDLGPRVEQVMKWVKWGRKHLPRKRATAPPRSRGTDIDFASEDSPPDVLFRWLEVDGEVEHGGGVVRFAGAVQGLTPQAKRYGQPTFFELKASGPTEVLVRGIVDHTGEVPEERLAVAVPAIDQKARLLGDPDRLALAVSPGRTSLMVWLSLKGDALGGKVVVRQGPVELTPHVAQRYGGEVLCRGISETVREIRSIEATVELAGTLKEPRCRLECDLGRRLAAGFERALVQEAERQARAVEAKIDEVARGKLQALEGFFAQRQAELARMLKLERGEAEQLKQLIAGQLNVPGELLGAEALDRLLKRR